MEGASDVRSVVFEHFKARNEIRHVVDDLHFRSLSRVLIKLFNFEEVKVEIWDCFKSSGLDGINFSFFKDFWLEIKDEIVR